MEEGRAFPIANRKVRPLAEDVGQYSVVSPDVLSTEVLRPRRHAECHQEQKSWT